MGRAGERAVEIAPELALGVLMNFVGTPASPAGRAKPGSGSLDGGGERMADALNEVNPLYTGAIDVIEGADAYDRDDYVGMGRATAGLGVTIVMTIITWKGGKTTRGPPKGNGNKRPGNRGHPDHQADVKGGGKRQAEALARPGERVVMEGRIEGHPGINRRADNQVIGTDNRTRVVVESERRPGGTYHKKRVKELEAAGIEVHTRPPSQWGK